jgi:hypothetical protein
MIHEVGTGKSRGGHLKDFGPYPSLPGSNQITLRRNTEMGVLGERVPQVASDSES